MKILSAAQIKEADSHTIGHEPVASIDLMERAALACVDEILHMSAMKASHYCIVCGRGNNGGDGLAIARMLHQAGRRAEVYVLDYTTKSSTDFDINYERLRGIAGIAIEHFSDAEHISFVNKECIIIDAILGTGTDRAPEGLIAAVIEKINRSSQRVIAIDLPSGLPADGAISGHWPVVKASVTLTFQQPKLAFMLPESGEYIGDFRILDIGLSRDFIDKVETPYHYLEGSDLSPLLLPRAKFSHKGTYGHSLLIAGAHGHMGAAVLAAHACLRSGTGLLTTHIPACGYDIMQTSLPEAMVTTDSHTDHISILHALDRYTSIGVGPGVGTHADTAKALKLLIQSTPCPLVLDADALNIIAENKTWLAFMPPRCILTPHPKEFDRLTEKHTDSRSRLQSAQALAHKHDLIVVLKGAHTAIVMPDRSVWFNSSGSPALAKGGSGDILTGIITALISRGYGAREATFIGVYLHGLAADLATEHIHPESLMASDVVAHISGAFEKMYEHKI